MPQNVPILFIFATDVVANIGVSDVVQNLAQALARNEIALLPTAADTFTRWHP